MLQGFNTLVPVRVEFLSESIVPSNVNTFHIVSSQTKHGKLITDVLQLFLSYVILAKTQNTATQNSETARAH